MVDAGDFLFGKGDLGSGTSSNTIVDFQHGDDVINLRAFHVKFADLHFSKFGTGTPIE